MTSLTEKTAIITGPTSGIGRSFALHLAKKGYRLLLIARREDKLSELCRYVEQHYNTKASYLRADLAEEASIAMVEKELSQLPSVDLLINNAGFGVAGHFGEIPLQEQMNMVNVHISSTLRFTYAVLPAMKKQRRGAIINVASLSAFMVLPGNVMYATTKAAMIRFSQTLQTELQYYNIRVQALSPGFTRTDFHASIPRRSEYMQDIPKWLWISPEEVVKASLINLKGRRVICIPGIINKTLYHINKNKVIALLMRKMVGHRLKPLTKHNKAVVDHEAATTS
ncbi:MULTISPECIES: SDR family NAD(P)-dependent oxidoreductase [unclassified Carboxylicivirga]|uniref:SDR family NAD(P)-dependent oxidoreductase n=1 Tax=Carboxylicivirga TaxID=1628153 RepID=UPI003D335C70